MFLRSWHVTCRFDVQDASAIYWWGSTLCLMKMTSIRETHRSRAHAAQCSTCNASQMQRLLWIALRDLSYLSILQNDLLLLLHAFATFGCKTNQKEGRLLRSKTFPPTVSKASKNTVFYSVLEEESIREIKSLKTSLVCKGLPAVLKRSFCCQVCIKEKHKEGLPACRTTSRRADRQLRPWIAEKRWSQ